MERFFSADWYRVAGLRPRLAGHVTVERQRAGSQAWYVLHDRLSGRVHRMTPQAYLFAARLDGRASVDEVWQGLVAELDEAAPGQETVLQLLMQLHGADLLSGDVPPDTAALLRRRDRMARALWARNARSPLAIQVPLIDPDRMLEASLWLVRPLLGRAGLALWCLLVVAGLLTALRHWDALSGDVLDRLMGAEGLVALALCYPVMKVLHELAHGYVAKRFGCEVREMGLMFLVLIPVPYVDASASAALASRWQRAAVAFAGIAMEMALAAAAALVWVAAEPGLLRAVAFNVMVIGGLSTVLVNGNPLLRFDGYYVLSDLLAAPNLAQRGVRYWGILLNRVLGVAELRSVTARPFERLVFLVYTPVSLAYRIVVMLGVAIFVAGHYFVLGVAMAAVTLGLGLVWPVARALWRVASGPLYRRCRARAACLTFGALGVVAALLLLVPAPLHTTAEGVIWLPEPAIVRAGADGFVLSAHPSGPVAQGAALLTLEHPIAAARLAVTEARIGELRAKYTAEWVSDRVAAGVTRFELEQQESVAARERQRQARMTVVAGTDGRFTPARPAADLRGRYVKEGEVLGWVAPRQGQSVRVLVPQADIGLMHDRLRSVSVLLADRRTRLAAQVLRAVPAGAEELPSEALASQNGGTILTDPRGGRTLRAFERLFQFDLALPWSEAVAEAGWGTRVLVRFDYAWEPVGDMIYRRLRQGLLSRFEA